MAKLVKAVHVKDPDRNRTVLLLPGEEPEPRLAAQVTNPDAWEDGQLPGTASGDGDAGGDDKDSDDGQPSEDTPKAAPAAKKTAARKPAASKPARGRDAADKGDGGV